MIANLRIQLEKHQGPIISGKPAGLKSHKPPLATGPSFMPGGKEKGLVLVDDKVGGKIGDVRSQSIGVSQEGKRTLQTLP